MVRLMLHITTSWQLYITQDIHPPLKKLWWHIIDRTVHLASPVIPNWHLSNNNKLPSHKCPSHLGPVRPRTLLHNTPLILSQKQSNNSILPQERQQTNQRNSMWVLWRNVQSAQNPGKFSITNLQFATYLNELNNFLTVMPHPSTLSLSVLNSMPRP